MAIVTTTNKQGSTVSLRLDLDTVRGQELLEVLRTQERLGDLVSVEVEPDPAGEVAAGEPTPEPVEVDEKPPRGRGRPAEPDPVVE